MRWLGEVRLLRDEASLRASFAELGKEGIQRLADGSRAPDDLPTEVVERAWQAYTASYRQRQRLHSGALADLAQCWNSLPLWATSLFEHDEIAQITGGGER